MPINVAFQPLGRSTQVEKGETIWTAAETAGVPLASVCGGQSICGKCRVRVLHGEVTPVVPLERDLLAEEELQEGYRLACEARILGPVVIETPQVSEDRRSKLTTLSTDSNPVVRSGIHKVNVTVPPPSLSDPRSDEERLRDTLSQMGYLPPAIALDQLAGLSLTLRKHAFQLTCVFQDERFLAFEGGDTTSAHYGLAVDIGTTTVAAYLVHLGSGERLEAAAISNRQAIFGDDVMSRLACAQAGGLDKLRQTAIAVLNDLIFMVCQASGVESSSVYGMTVTGNTSMLHFLAGLPTDHLGVAPYVAVTSDLVTATAADLGLEIHPHAAIWLLPGIGAFAGADCVCAAAAANMADNAKTSLLIDFGTNAEIILGSREELYACATAAGPAFEGARIKDGMRAAPGAIDHVWITDGNVRVHTIDDLPAVGLTGTGLVAAVAALRKEGLLDDRGLFAHHNRLDSSWWKTNGNKRTLLLTQPARQRSPIKLSQSDIGEFQLAKAAVRAGIRILQRRMGISDEDIDQILLAGAFGSFMDPAAALAADLLPDVAVERVRSVGNAAGVGAVQALLNQTVRENYVDLARRINYVELSVEPDFNHYFARSLSFKR